MYDFEETLKNNQNVDLFEVVNKAKIAIPKRIKEDKELLKLKETDPKQYMRQLENEFPYFAEKYPFLFDKIIDKLDDLELLDLMLSKLKWTNKRNYKDRTQEIVDIVSSQKEE